MTLKQIQFSRKSLKSKDESKISKVTASKSHATNEVNIAVATLLYFTFININTNYEEGIENEE